MKLYYFPGACSMAPHIALREAGVDFDLVKVDLANRTTDAGTDYTDINPNGYVPALELDNGEVLTECAVILQFIADQNPASGLAPAAGTMERYRLMESVHFIATELHKSFSPLFNPQSSDEAKKNAIDNITNRFERVNAQLEGRDFLLGDTFTVADAYLATIIGWTQHVQFDLSPWPNIGAYAGRVMARPQVQETLKAEGLM